ncbi:MAG TPA: glycosyltransferase family 2 protein [Stellaceae bacterium]|nr:glycosyltransferase family 2 protein [Stellaceae bacterium]
MTRPAAQNPSAGAPELCVIVPTFNECDNVAVLVERLDAVLGAVDWEVIFVDDDSPDGTAERVRALGARDRRVRCLRRIGRRGLSSACIEGVLSTSARFVAVIDGDLQHDESLLPSLLETLKRGGVDVAVASRHVGSGSSEGLSSERRKRLSLYGIRLAQRLLKAEIADPASGFFMLRRELFDDLVPRLSGVGTKILIDLLASSPQPLRVAELPYRFRPRHAGESKLDTFTGIEYMLLLAEKLSHRYFPHRLLLFGLVGATGVVLNLVVLRLLMLSGWVGFTAAEAIATVSAMVSNFFLNNSLTYRDCRLTGWQAIRGLLSFAALCSLGALTTIAVARDLYQFSGMWLLAGFLGAVIGALLNYALTSIFTWKRQT